MIRRGFWFTAGAVAGIAGYRRVSRAARTLLPQADLLAPLGRRIAGPAARRVLAGGSGPASGQLDSAAQHGQARRLAGPGRAAAGQKAAAGTAAFVRDVRAGMADYLDSRPGV